VNRFKPHARSHTRTLGLSLLGLCSSLSIVFSHSQAQSQSNLSIGQDSFVFDRLENLKGFSPNAVKRVDGALEFIGQINRVLAQQNIQLTVVVVPSVRRIYPEKLPSSFKTSEELQGLYTHVLDKLRADGVFMPDLQTALINAKAKAGNEFLLYMRQDNHWSTVGAFEAAKVIAASIGTKWASSLKELPEHKSSYEWLAPVLYEGNFYRNLSKQDQMKIVQEQLRPIKYNQQDAGNLLGDDTPGITLVGTSFSHLKEFAFSNGLAHFLNRDVLNAAESGKGFWTPLLDYLSSDAFANTPPKLLIWEIPEDHLAPGYPPFDWADDWARRQYALELAANIKPNCAAEAIKPVAFASADFSGDATRTHVDSSTKASFVKFSFENPIRNDQYLSLRVTSKNTESMELQSEGPQIKKYATKFPGYGVQHRLNVPMAILSDGTNRSVTLNVSPGSDLTLEGAHLCTIPAELNKWANPSK
jgi:alginate O-acetyltransferase complex protein AlgJ